MRKTKTEINLKSKIFFRANDKIVDSLETITITITYKQEKKLIFYRPVCDHQTCLPTK